ncbi:acetylxylan esterase [Paenibacillus sp. CMAA1364]
MSYMDDKMKNLYDYIPSLTKKDDFDEFWDMTIQEAKSTELQGERSLVDYPSTYVKVYSISYSGMDNTRIHGWYIVPNFGPEEKYPCIIHYHGFNWNRGQPSEFMHWINMGLAVLSVDCRDQGGITGSLATSNHGYSQNVASKGILNKDDYYYRYVYMDCLRALDFACEQEEVDVSKIVIEGGSQGGGLGMAVCALDPRPVLAMVDVPSNSDLVSRVDGCHGAFTSIGDFIKKHPTQADVALENLSYFDTMNMADKISCKVLASVALKDEICPPQMYFATYNRIMSEKQVEIYPFNGHEGGGVIQTEIKLKYLKQHFSDWFV